MINSKHCFTLIVIFSALSTVKLQAQDWGLIYPSEKFNYHEQSEVILINKMLFVDSVYNDEDTLVYDLNRALVPCTDCEDVAFGPQQEDCYSEDCFYREDQPQFAGHTIRILPDFTWQLLGDETKQIKPRANLGDSWEYTPGTIAMVSAVYLGEVFGVSDSLKQIETSYGDTLVLSQSHGMLKWISTTYSYELVGQEVAGLGESLLRFKDVFSFGIGDVFEAQYYHHQGFTTIEELRRNDILALISETDSTIEYIERRRVRRFDWNGSQYYDSIDTVVYRASDYPMLELDCNESALIPEGYIPDIPEWHANANQYVDSGITVRAFGIHLPLYEFGDIYIPQDDFTDTLILEYIPSLTPNVYSALRLVDNTTGVHIMSGVSFGRGLGKMSFYNTPDLQFTHYTTTGLILAGDTSGTLSDTLLWNGLTDFAIEPLSIYPNPTQDRVIVDVPKSIRSAELRITSIIGEAVLNRKIRNSGSLELDLELLPGVYLVSILSDGRLYSSKLIVQ